MRKKRAISSAMSLVMIIGLLMSMFGMALAVPADYCDVCDAEQCECENPGVPSAFSICDVCDEDVCICCHECEAVDCMCCEDCFMFLCVCLCTICNEDPCTCTKPGITATAAVEPQILIEDNTADTSGHNWTWVQSTRTLTLNGVNLVVPNDTAIRVPANSIIFLTSGSKNKVSGQEDILVDGNLEIRGSGTLEAGYDVSDGTGIRAGYGTATSGNLTISGGLVTVYSENDIGGLSAAGSVIINGGSVNVTAPYGITGGNNVTINGGTTIIFSSKAGINSNDIKINGGTMHLVGGSSGGTNSVMTSAPSQLPATYWWSTNTSTDLTLTSNSISPYIWAAGQANLIITTVRQITEIPGNSGGVTIPVTQDDNTIILNLTPTLINSIIASAEGGTNVHLDISGAAVNAVSIPSELFQAASSGNKTLQLDLPLGSIQFDSGALSTLAGQTGNLEIAVEKANPINLPAVQQDKVNEGDAVFSITATAGATAITNFNGTLTITVPFDGPFPARVWYLNNAGELVSVKCSYDATKKTVTFTTNHLSIYLVRQGVPPTSDNTNLLLMGIIAITSASGLAVMVIFRKRLFAVK